MAKRILVTGASRGIGKAIAFELARSGYDIALHYPSKVTGEQDIESSLKSIGAKVSCMQFNVADRAVVKDSLDADIAQNGAYYGVILNTGINHDTVFPAMTNNDWDEVIHTNLDGFYNVIHPCVMPMIQAHQGGRIITIASIAGIVGARGQVNYSASKAGVIGATKALSVELAARKITVNCIAPGLVETDTPAAISQEMVKEVVPMRRVGKPSEIAAVAKFLISDDASYITRQVISVNGGLL